MSVAHKGEDPSSNSERERELTEKAGSLLRLLVKQVRNQNRPRPTILADPLNASPDEDEAGKDGRGASFRLIRHIGSW